MRAWGAPRKRGRQNSKKVEYFGNVFDSQAEGDRYLELRAMEESGEIASLQCHVTYILQPPFVMGNGEKVRAITYTPDFVYYRGGKTYIEDVKGWKLDKETGKRTPIIQDDAELKIKMLKFIFPNAIFLITGNGNRGLE